MTWEENRAAAMKHWVFDPKWVTLTCQIQVNGRTMDRYEIDLENCRTSARLLDWIIQIALKSWATPEIIAGLVWWFWELLDPQRYLCSFGRECGPIDVKATLATVAEFRALADEIGKRMEMGQFVVKEEKP